MSYISREHRLLFMATPGTGSSAFIKALQTQGIGEFYPPVDMVVDGRRVAPRKHTTVRQMVEAGLMTPEIEAFHRVASIRNPFSLYVAKYLRNRTLRENNLRNKRSWVWRLPEIERERYRREIERSLAETFESYVRRTLSKAVWRMPMQGFLEGATHLIHQEDVDHDVEVLKALVGLPAELTVPLFNVTGAMEEGRSYRDFYTPDLVDFVMRVNQAFFRRYTEYSFEGYDRDKVYRPG